MKLIDKDAVVAEIKKLSQKAKELYGYSQFNTAYDNVLSLLDTLEVKDMNYEPIDKDFERDAVQFCFDKGLNTTPYIAKTIAKHFFELGFKAIQKGE